MDIQKTFKDAVDIALLKEPAMHAVTTEKDGLKSALLMIVVGALASSFGTFIFPSTYGMITYRPDITWVLSSFIVASLIGIALLYLMGFLAERLFHSKLSMESYVKILGHASILNFISIIPALSIVSGIWGLVVMWIVLTKLGKLEAGSVILLLIIEFVLVFGVMGMGVGAGMGMMYSM